MEIPIITENGNSAWPELFPMDKINDIRKNVGERHFSAQMMLRYTPSDKLRLDPGLIQFYSDVFNPNLCTIGEHKITGITMYWDPSIGHSNSDGSVCVLLYRDDKNKTIFLHDMIYLIVPDIAQHPLTYQCNHVIDFMTLHNVSRINIEVNGLGNALPEIMSDVAIKRGVAISVQKITNHANKESRILDAIEPPLTAGRFFAHNRITQTPFCSEMLGWTPFGTADHDDGLDAVAGAISATAIPIRPIGARIQTLHANTNFKI